MPRGGWLREVCRWACCGLRRTGGPSPGFWGVFIIAVHRAFVLGLGARHRGIVEAVRSQGIDVCLTVFAFFTPGGDGASGPTGTYVRGVDPQKGLANQC